MFFESSHTYRLLLDWLEKRGVTIGYVEGIDMGLLEFNNALVDDIERLEEKRL